MNLTLPCLLLTSVLGCVLATKSDREPHSSSPQPVVSSGLEGGLRQEYGMPYSIGLKSADYQLPQTDLESSATNKRSSGYGGGGGGYGGSGSSGGSIIGSSIGGVVGDITGGILGRILRSLTGIGFRLGINLNNELYNVDQYGGGGGGGGGGGSGGYGQMQSYGKDAARSYGGNYGNGGNMYGKNDNYGSGNGYSQNYETVAAGQGNYGNNNEGVYNNDMAKY